MPPRGPYAGSLFTALQREAVERLGIDTWTYLNWEKGKTVSAAARFRPVMSFLSRDPTPEAETPPEHLPAKKRTFGITFEQVAKHSWVGSGVFDPVSKWDMVAKSYPNQSVGKFSRHGREGCGSASAIASVASPIAA